MIKVKFVDRSSKDKNSLALIRKQFPNEDLVWGNCKFTFDPFDQDYDWFVVRDDVPRVLPNRTEKLQCPIKNTILVTSEPSSITFYGKAFASQFGYLITSQNEKDLPHHNAHRSQTGSMWFYGKTYAEIKKEAPHKKKKLISIIASNKKEKHTLHKARFDFTNELIKEIPEVDVLFSYKRLANDFYEIFGDRAKLVNDKSEMLDNYKYHIAIGNQVGPHILTERITDALLAYSVPITYGCTNLNNYFPDKSYIDIDINNLDYSFSKIKKYIYNEEDYESRLDSVVKARELVLDKYNIIPMISKIVESSDRGEELLCSGIIKNRSITRLYCPQDLMKYILFRMKNFLMGR